MTRIAAWSPVQRAFYAVLGLPRLYRLYLLDVYSLLLQICEVYSGSLNGTVSKGQGFLGQEKNKVLFALYHDRPELTSGMNKSKHQKPWKWNSRPRSLQLVLGTCRRSTA